MKEYKGGFTISLFILILLFVVNEQIYHNVMALHAPILFLSLHVMVHKHLIPEKRYGAYFFFVFVVGASIFFSMPEFTHQQAQEHILANYNQDLELTEQDNLPLDRSDVWHPFAPSWGYAFLGTVPSSGENISLLFIPDNGKFFEIAP
ncbi:hypothetical protein B0H99_103180 [Planomicrobium soli]|uniref:Uncharacterized protein n=1 Tax=Planomicrobium soli TaxID=1176648 RepID=A0A2P8H491_9BACL|nr:hypothetical protein [Planomicrobium soli]PSL41046.1 hypothetical protein B0H99_103180 [Planomicrobium soli]